MLFLRWYRYCFNRRLQRAPSSKGAKVPCWLWWSWRILLICCSGSCRWNPLSCRAEFICCSWFCCLYCWIISVNCGLRSCNSFNNNSWIISCCCCWMFSWFTSSLGFFRVGVRVPSSCFILTGNESWQLCASVLYKSVQLLVFFSCCFFLSFCRPWRICDNVSSLEKAFIGFLLDNGMGEEGRLMQGSILVLPRLCK